MSRQRGNRRPRVAAPVQPPGKPRKPRFTPDDANGRLIILMSRVDTDGPWCLSKIAEEHHRDLLEKIRQWETMTVHQVFDQSQEPGKDYPLDAVIAAARTRLRELAYDDRDQISRLRLTGKRRLYGFREGHRFYAIWWDAEHKICESSKRNT